MSDVRRESDPSGVYRRRIRLRGEPGRVVAALEDDPHHFRVVLRHDGERVIEAVGEGVRYPWTTCPGAAGALRALSGMPLSPRCTAVGKHADARANCTHMFDLAGLAVAHAASGRALRQYDCAVRESPVGTSARLARDGEPLLAWWVADGSIREPAPYAGVPLLGGGFMAWAESALEPELAEAAIVLRRACFVAPSRRVDLDAYERAADMPTGLMLGRCHTFSESHIDAALRVKGTVLDFTESPEALLRDPVPE